MLIAFFANFDNKPFYNPFHNLKEEEVIDRISCDIGEQMGRDFKIEEEVEITKFCKKLYQFPNLIYTTSLSTLEEFFTDPIITVENYYVERLEAIVDACERYEEDFLITTHIGLYHFTIYRIDPKALEPYKNVLRQYTINQVLKSLD